MPIRGWRRFSVAYSANISGDRFVDLAIPVISIAFTGGLHLAGVYIAANSIPRLFIGPLIAGVMQRRPNVSWCSIGNTIQALAIGLLVLLMWTDEQAAWVFGLSGVISGTGAGIFGLALQATVRNIVPNSKLPSANSTLEVIDSLFTLLVPVTGGVLVDRYGATPVLAATSLLFALAAVFRMGLTTGERNEGTAPMLGDEESGNQLRDYIASAVHTLVVPFRKPHRRFISLAALALGAGSLLLIPVATSQIHHLDGGATSVGLAISMAGAGGLLASFLAGRIVSVTRSARWTLTLLLVTLASVPAVFLSPSLLSVVILVCISDAVASWLYVSLPTLRMATEAPNALINIAAGMISWQAMASFIVGLGVSLTGEGASLVLFVLLTVTVLAVAAVWQGTPRILGQVQARADGSGNERE